MSAAFLHRYEAELEYLRRALGEFEQAHPQKARALGVEAGRITDPDLHRLADGFALASARLHDRIEAGLPEFALDLARMLFPGVLLGAPSYAALAPAAGLAALPGPLSLPAGAVLDLGEEGAPRARFVAARPVRLAPVACGLPELLRAPFPFEVPEAARGAEVALCLPLVPADPGAAPGAVLGDEVELYVAGPAARKWRLVGALCSDLLAIGTAGQTPRQTALLPRGRLGLSLDEPGHEGGFLPGHPAEMPGLALLRDFLAYPDKAAFFTLSGLADAPGAGAPGPLMLRLFLGPRAAQALGRVEPGDIALNVVPAVNCFEALSEPLRHDFSRPAVPLVPRREAGMALEVLQILSLRELTPEGEVMLPEMSAPAARGAGAGAGAYRPAWQERFEGARFDRGRRDISFALPDGRAGLPAPIDVVATLLCSNGAEGFRPRPGARGTFAHDGLADLPFALVDEPTAPIAPDLGSARLWDMLALVGGNFATLLDAADPAAGLRRALHLAAPAGHCEAAGAIDAVALSQSVAPLALGGSVILSAGTRIEVVIDPEALPWPVPVFATVLRQFLAGFVSYDRFFQLSLRRRGQSAPLVAFPKIHGSQPCL